MGIASFDLTLEPSRMCRYGRLGQDPVVAVMYRKTL